MFRLFILALLLPTAILAESPKRKPIVLTDEARAIQKEALLIDGHNDLAWRFREKNDLSFLSIDIRRPQKGLHTDIPRLRGRRRRSVLVRVRARLHAEGSPGSENDVGANRCHSSLRKGLSGDI